MWIISYKNCGLIILLLLIKHRLENITMLIVFATIIAVASAAAPNRVATVITDSHNNSSLICETPECIHEASRMLTKINSDVDPCNNFYQFACGKFIKETVLLNNTLEIDVFSLIRQKLNDQIRYIITDDIKKDDLPVFQAIKLYYQTCMDTEKIENNFENDLIEVLKNDFMWHETKFSLENFLSESYKMGYLNNFIAVYIMDDRYSGDTSKYIITINSPDLFYIPTQLYHTTNTSEPGIKAYLKYLTDVSKILGGDPSRKDLIDLLEFEHKLTKLSSISTGSAQLMTVAELENKYPKIAWTEYLNRILAPNVHVDRNETVEVVNENYIRDFHSLIKTTPEHVIENYAQWTIIRTSILKTGIGRLAEARAESLGIRYDKLKLQRSRQNFCIERIKDSLSIAVGALYVRHYFDENMKTKAASLVKNIRKSFHAMIEQANWMDSITKNKALEKLDWMREIIGYPDELLDDNKLNEYYKDLKVYPESYLKFYNSVSGFYLKKSLLKLRKRENEIILELFGGVAEVDARYLVLDNHIDIKAGILKEEFFNVANPNYMNYGGIGWIIGHEITHGFDSGSSQYDKNGNSVNWWSPETWATYANNVKCIIDQYNNYTDKEVNMNINGYISQRENIADNGGLKAAYYAYNEWAKNNDQEPQLPGLDYTPQQMFWISAATSRCQKDDSKYRKQVVTDEHPPEEFRVIGSMSKLPEFSKDFQCPLGSPMNPVQKCSVW